MQNDKPCEKCGGVGQIQVGPDDWVRCICSFVRTFKAKVGPDVASARTIESSPFYVPGEPGEPPKVDKTTSNVFIRGWWSDLLPHLKYTLIWKNFAYNLQYFLQVTTDERLKAVYLGQEAYSSRSKKKRDEIETFNTLHDYVGPGYHLVIIQLGYLGYSNKAMAGILQESLLLRQANNLPTWILEKPDCLYDSSHFAYSPQVADFFNRYFEVIDLTNGDPVAQRNELSSDEGISLDDGEDLEEALEFAARTSSPPVPPSPDLDKLISDVTGPSKKKKKGGRW